MPIYEFYCKECNTIFSFFSQSVNTTKKPLCPKCKMIKLSRQVSIFAFTGKANQEDQMTDLPIDENKMEKALETLANEAEQIGEEDPRQAANLMRKLTDMTGLEMGDSMQEALRRMENGEDPEKVEAEMGDLLETEDPFVLTGKKGARQNTKALAPIKDETLYDL